MKRGISLFDVGIVAAHFSATHVFFTNFPPARLFFIGEAAKQFGELQQVLFRASGSEISVAPENY